MKNSSFCTAPRLDKAGNPQFCDNNAHMEWVEPDTLTQEQRKQRNAARNAKKALRNFKKGK